MRSKGCWQDKMEWLDSLFIVGALLVLTGVGNAAIILKRNNWPTTDGKVLLNRVETDYKFEHSKTSISSFGRLSMPVMRTVRRNKIKYVFVVGEYKYENGKIYSSPLTLLEDRRPINLKVGDYLKISYCPTNPHKSYLLTSPLWPSALITGVGVAILAIGYFWQA